MIAKVRAQNIQLKFIIYSLGLTEVKVGNDHRRDVGIVYYNVDLIQMYSEHGYTEALQTNQ